MSEVAARIVASGVRRSWDTDQGDRDTHGQRQADAEPGTERRFSRDGEAHAPPILANLVSARRLYVLFIVITCGSRRSWEGRRRPASGPRSRLPPTSRRRK